jgi:hypothetical protein
MRTLEIIYFFAAREKLLRSQKPQTEAVKNIILTTNFKSLRQHFRKCSPEKLKVFGSLKKSAKSF